MDTEEIIIFLNEICIVFGICDTLYNLEDILYKKWYSANNFVKEIFKYKGLEDVLTGGYF